jgi:hypothetical protein
MWDHKSIEELRAKHTSSCWRASRSARTTGNILAGDDRYGVRDAPLRELASYTNGRRRCCGAPVPAAMPWFSRTTRDEQALKRPCEPGVPVREGA